MKTRLYILPAAAEDIVEQSDWYSSKANGEIANRWEHSVTASVLRILDIPESGSPWNFATPELRGVRRTPVESFPRHLIFYRVSEMELQIIRVLHGSRDIESLFAPMPES